MTTNVVKRPAEEKARGTENRGGGRKDESDGPRNLIE